MRTTVFPTASGRMTTEAPDWSALATDGLLFVLVQSPKYPAWLTLTYWNPDPTTENATDDGVAMTGAGGGEGWGGGGLTGRIAGGANVNPIGPAIPAVIVLPVSCDVPAYAVIVLPFTPVLELATHRLPLASNAMPAGKLRPAVIVFP
jgi:hypothetical protein